MPHYQLPPIKKDAPPQDAGLAVASSHSPDEWARTLNIPVNQAILTALEVDGEVVVTLRGKVTGLSSNESTQHSSASITVVVSSVDAYPAGDEDSNLFEDSFIKARGRFPGKRY